MKAFDRHIVSTLKTKQLPTSEPLEIENIKTYIYYYDWNTQYVVKRIKNGKIDNKFIMKKMTSEDIIKALYKNKGYEVLKLNPTEMLSVNTVHILWKEAKLNLKNKLHLPKGIPDFLVYAINEYFFVEVKKPIQSLSASQFKWIRENARKPVKVIYLLDVKDK